MGAQNTDDGATESVSSLQKKPRITKGVVIACVVVLLALGGGVALWLTHRHKATKPTSTSTAPAQNAKAVAYQATKDDADKYFNEGKYDDALTAINKYLAANPPNTPEAKEYTKKLTVLGGTDYLGVKNYPKAIEYYNQSLALSTDPYDQISAHHGLATAYEDMGDKDSAIAQYKAARTIALPIANEQAASRFILRDEKAITRLGGQL